MTFAGTMSSWGGLTDATRSEATTLWRRLSNPRSGTKRYSLARLVLVLLICFSSGDVVAPARRIKAAMVHLWRHSSRHFSVHLGNKTGHTLHHDLPPLMFVCSAIHRPGSTALPCSPGRQRLEEGLHLLQEYGKGKEDSTHMRPVQAATMQPT
jgi:hypothetical protein